MKAWSHDLLFPDNDYFDVDVIKKMPEEISVKWDKKKYQDKFYFSDFYSPSKTKIDKTSRSFIFSSIFSGKQNQTEGIFKTCSQTIQNEIIKMK